MSKKKTKEKSESQIFCDEVSTVVPCQFKDNGKKCNNEGKYKLVIVGPAYDGKMIVCSKHKNPGENNLTDKYQKEKSAAQANVSEVKKL